MWRVGLALMKPCGYLWKPTSEDLLKENYTSVFGLSQICAPKHNQFQRDEMYFLLLFMCVEMLFKRIQSDTPKSVFACFLMYGNSTKYYKFIYMKGDLKSFEM